MGQPMTPDMEYRRVVAGRRIRNRRKKLGLSQYQLADRAGVTQACVSGYETGKRMPHHDELLRLAAALGVTGSDVAKPLQDETLLRDIGELGEGDDRG